MASTKRTPAKPTATVRPRRAPPARRAAAPRTGAAIRHASDATFAGLVAGADAVLVDLWAPWCPPCLAQGPILAKVARKLGRKVKVVRVNVDENPVLVRSFRVTSIPKLVLVRGGRRRTHVGLLGEAALEAWVREGLAAE